MTANSFERLEAGLLDDARDVFDASLTANGFVECAHGHGGAFGGRGMRVEDDGVSRRDDIDDVAADCGNRVCGRGDGTYDAEGRVFFEHDAVIAAHGIRSKPFDAGHQFNNLQLFDLVIQSTDLRLFKLDATPFARVRVGHGFDDVDDLAASFDALLLELVESVVRGGACLACILKHTKMFSGRPIAIMAAAVHPVDQRENCTRSWPPAPGRGRRRPIR